MWSIPKLRDRDLVKTSRPKLQQKIRDRDLSFITDTRDLKICGLSHADIFLKMFQKMT